MPAGAVGEVAAAVGLDRCRHPGPAEGKWGMWKNAGIGKGTGWGLMYRCVTCQGGTGSTLAEGHRLRG